jgi:hypothetical protein
MIKSKSHLIIVGLGEVVPYKYLECIKKAINRRELDSYSIIDLESQRNNVEKRIRSVDLKPENVFYLPDRTSFNISADQKDFKPVFRKLLEQKSRLKVFISTEVKAHEAYLRFCVENGIDSLVEKPVFAPTKKGYFNPCVIESKMKSLIRSIRKKPANHSVMILGRYHRVYNDEMVDILKNKIIELQAPITSFHLRTASGVWNLYREYESREDHPYKYGYGMLMHGAYHYVDLMIQFLELNKIIYPRDDFLIDITSYVAYPEDQKYRIPKKFNADFSDNAPKWSNRKSGSNRYGETDIVSVFCLKNKRTKKVLTLGSISLEQTTPSIRSWKDIPEGFYNKNGRVSCTDIEVQLSVLYSMHGRSFKIPRIVDSKISKIDNYAIIQTRANASILKKEKYNTEKIISGFFNSDSNRKLMTNWFQNKENRSQLEKHYSAMKVTQAIALSLKKPGYPITIDLFEKI